jgi:uncharacterized protein (DUF58 family)
MTVDRQRALDELLFDESLLRRMERLALVIRKRRAGQLSGERRSTKRGSSVEFADYRDYTKGDDLRRVDWNIYARLERPFVKLFEEEEDLAVHLLLDASASMDWSGLQSDPKASLSTGAPLPTNKWVYARRTAAALGYIALGSGDQVVARVLRDNVAGGKPDRFGPARGKGQALHLLRLLSHSQTGGATDLNRSLRDYASSAHRPGLLVLLTDLFSPPGYQEGLGMLLAAGYEALLLHILAPEEASPRLAGDLKLIDVESGHAEEVTVDAGLRSLYRRRIAAWQLENSRWCAQRGVHYITVTTDTPFDELILFHLRHRGLVR